MQKITSFVLAGVAAVGFAGFASAQTMSQQGSVPSSFATSANPAFKLAAPAQESGLNTSANTFAVSTFGSGPQASEQTGVNFSMKPPAGGFGVPVEDGRFGSQSSGGQGQAAPDQVAAVVPNNSFAAGMQKPASGLDAFSAGATNSGSTFGVK